MGRAFEYRRASKEKRWDKMSKIYPKLSRAITVAAREGGSDPDANPRLRAAIAMAKTENMPKDNIEKAIERASGRDESNYHEVNYEGKASHGILLWVECATDNNTRTVANIRLAFSKGGGTLLESGSLEFMFSRKSVIEFKVPEGGDIEEIELALIDFGLEELEIHGQKAYATGDFTSFGALSRGCEELGLEIEKATVQRVANQPIEVTEEQMVEVEKLIDRLEDDDDVQAVYTNIA
jgi:YebC/PmpR family DNA-binding regulatory protein